ncbi:MAG: hypothetical protein EA426_12175 [Spirochaetaceae bacterium]|nr:MAG: hypothetical protein EA426_12175 [Spirochaetaceae bacterium]
MALNSVLRLISVLVVMLVIGFGWYGVTLSRLKKKGIEPAKAVPQAKLVARKASLIAAFVYMVAMVSVAGLFM